MYTSTVVQLPAFPTVIYPATMVTAQSFEGMLCIFACTRKNL